MKTNQPRLPQPPPQSPETAFNEIWRRLDNLERLVFLGNGQPSLKEQMAEQRRALQTQTWLIRSVLAGVVSNLIGIAFLFFRRGV